MLDPAAFVRIARDQGVSLFTGVPDSLLKELCKHLDLTVSRRQHVIAANEGAAVGVAIGHYLSTGTPAVVYMQNSGFGNMVNPLLSLADPDVYGIPMVILVGWRGQAGVKDEPQHVKQGRVMAPLLDAIGVPWAVLPKDEAAAEQCLKEALACDGPYVLMVEKDTFSKAVQNQHKAVPSLPSREEALTALAAAVGQDAAIVSTTGMLSRELFEYRERTGATGQDFLTVGGMGHASSIALGVANGDPEREVWCFDGDGALLMHMGSLAVIADQAPARYFHVVFNNGVHDSVGGQPTSVGVVDVVAAARAMGYRHAASTADVAEVPELVARLRATGGPSLLELRVRPGNRADIGRPTRTPEQNKQAFMTMLRGGVHEA